MGTSDLQKMRKIYKKFNIDRNGHQFFDMHYEKLNDYRNVEPKNKPYLDQRTKKEAHN